MLSCGGVGERRAGGEVPGDAREELEARFEQKLTRRDNGHSVDVSEAEGRSYLSSCTSKHNDHKHILSNMSGNVVAFNSKSADASVRCLSNFALLAVTVDGTEYPSGEHAFHGCKFLLAAAAAESDNAPRATAIRKHAQLFAHPSALKTGLDAKRAGGKSKKHGGFALSNEELAGWHAEAKRVQEEICKYKLEHYMQIQQALAATKSKLLLHQDNRAKKGTPWGGRVDPSAKKGQRELTMQDIIGCNGLGGIWMKLRSKTLHGSKRRGIGVEASNCCDDDAGRNNKKLKIG